MPFISIVIPAYDNAANLPACLNSVLAQDYHDWEAIVVVDGSPDNSVEITAQYAKEDSRICLINKVTNEGTHRARMSGVESASGDYLLFLDADDELAPYGLGKLARLAEVEPSVDVIHFGMEQLDAGVSSEMYEGFLASCNRQFPVLFGEEIAKSSFVFDDRPTQDWRVLQRLYRTKLIKKAFCFMTKDRLGRGQDAYEWLVISSLASSESFHNDVLAYRYYFGRGITNTMKMSSEEFEKLAKAYSCLIEAAKNWTESSGLSHLDSCSGGLAGRLCELLFADWEDRVPDDEKDKALSCAALSMGRMSVAAELMRLSRDDAYAHWDAGDGFDSDARYMHLFRLGEQYSRGEDPSDRYRAFCSAATRHISDLQGRNCLTGQLNAVRRITCFLKRRFGKV